MALGTKLQFKLPPLHDWRTTDSDEINKRRARAREEFFRITNTDARHPIFSNFRVQSRSGQTYSVEVRDLARQQFGCDCVDFRINGLGICKHSEAVLLHLMSRQRKHFREAQDKGSDRVELGVDRASGTLRIFTGLRQLPKAAARFFSKEGNLAHGSPEEATKLLSKLQQNGFPQIRISHEAAAWLENRRRADEARELRKEYELKVQAGEWPAQETTVPLFPYQREGMLHLAFSERALLADEMGLGKTIQAIAACALLHRLGKARRVLVITPASLKTEWEEQITRFTNLGLQVVFGGKPQRLRAYESAPPSAGSHAFFTIVNYEQILSDLDQVNSLLAPDVIVLDEAQRIKNWSTRTAQSVKRLKSRYAFVLTGTPIENRIDELHSLMDFLNPAVLGPLFRFNRDFYELDDRGRPVGCKNLDRLHQRIKPFMLRRRKEEVETELPERTDRNHFVPMSNPQREAYATYEQHVSRLANLALRRPLSKQEQEKLQRELAKMRMTCDTNYILDQSDRTSPKLAELEKILEECRDNNTKVIIFSEWERMLELVREVCNRCGMGYAWHTGSVPQKRRRPEINRFKTDPECKVFLSTDAGATGLNLQNASVVINCDLPWNPAKLEQRIARAWRKHQTRPVTVINLISEDTIEHRMLQTLAVKKSVAETVLDSAGKVKEIKLRNGRQAFAERLQQLVGGGVASNLSTVKKTELKSPLPADPALAFGHILRERMNGALVRCEEHFPKSGSQPVIFVVVDRDADFWHRKINSIQAELISTFKGNSTGSPLLEIVDKETDEAIQRLVAAGVITRNIQAERSLLPAGGKSGPSPLSPEQKVIAAAYRSDASRKLEMAQLLGNGGFQEEARSPLLAGIQALASALAIENHLPPPSDPIAAFAPPLSYLWGEAIPLLHSFIDNPDADWQRAAECLRKYNETP